MYSPAASRKSFLNSSKTSPRKQILSPSDITPFSFSSETLNLFPPDDGPGHPLTSTPSRSSSFSQPRTPMGLDSSSGSFRSFQGSKSFSVGGAGSLSTPGGGRTVREYDETFRELKKENFNLKLRIYFLEERLGGSSRSSTWTSDGKEALLKANTDLKIQVESLKYDIKEKTELLQEAGMALEQLENKISILSVERQEEKDRLEARLRQLEEEEDEDKMAEALAMSAFAEDEILDRVRDELTSSSSSSTNKDEDDKLLKEVDAEMARGIQGTNVITKSNLILPINNLSSGNLAVVEEKLEAEDMASKLEEAERRALDLSDELKLALSEKEKVLLELHQVSEELEKARKDIDDQRASTTRLKAELATMYRDNVVVQEKKEELERLHQIIQKNEKEIEDLKKSLQEQKQMKRSDKGFADNVEVLDACPKLDDDSRFSVHTHRLKDSKCSKNSLQIVTQSLNIPPVVPLDSELKLAEANQLKRENDRLLQCLKRSDDERAILLRKIASLNDRLLADKSFNQIPQKDKSGKSLNNSRYLLIKVANLQQRLAHSCQDSDLLRSHLQSLADTLEPLINSKRPRAISQELVDNIKRVVDESRQISESVSRAPTPLKLESTEEVSNQSSSNTELPDPSNFDNDECEERSGGESRRLQSSRRLQAGAQSSSTIINNAAKEIANLLSEDEDSWSEPDVMAARKRMGLQTIANVRAAMDKDSSETDVEKQKSYYSLTYPTTESPGNLSEENADHDAAEQDVIGVENYSRIIEELQSHRREIEKLQMSNVSLDEVKEGDSCNLQAPGSLECIADKAKILLTVLDLLAYQLDISEGFDSGHATEIEMDDDEDDTEGETDFPHRIKFEACRGCSKVTCKEVQLSLQRSSDLILAATRMLRKLRKVSCSLSLKLGRAKADNVGRHNILSQLEEAHNQITKQNEAIQDLQDKLDSSQTECQDLQKKLNENYKLVAELSNENLRLTADKVRVDEVCQSLKNENRELGRKVEVLGQSCPVDASGAECGQPRPKFERKCVSCNISRNSGQGYSHSNPYSRGPRHHQRAPKHHHHWASDTNSSTSNRHPSKTHYQPWDRVSSKSALSDISSPDLGVDVSSDPFSSLERRPATTSYPEDVIPGSQDRQQMLVENKELRQERDVLMDKLLRSKGALKETLERLNASTESASSRHALTSSSLLESVGSAPSRERVTQDLVEFSRLHGRRSRGSRSRHRKS